MSSWSEVHAGDAHARLDGIVPDATGELPNTPDLLTELACAITNHRDLTFTESIEDRGDDDPDATSGTYRMRAAWIALFADLTDEQVNTLGQRWARECDPGTTDASSPTSLVRSLRDLCRLARNRNVPLIYTWTL